MHVLTLCHAKRLLEQATFRGVIACRRAGEDARCIGLRLQNLC